MNAMGVKRASLRVTRREAAKILQTSYENVKRLQRVGQLHSEPDRYGVHRFERREVEELARRRGLQIKPSGELAAAVFAMFKAHARFEDVVIATQQEPDTILALWERFNAGFNFGRDRTDDGTRELREHEEQLRAMDLELERRRERILNDA